MADRAVREEDAEFGILALERGLVDQKVLDDCLAAVAGGSDLTLPEIFRQRRILSESEITGLMEEARRRVASRAVLPVVSPPPQPAPAPAAGGPEVGPAGIPPEVEALRGDPGRRFGIYILVRPVGRGSASEVWKAWDTAAGRWVALKMLREDPAVAAELLRGVGPALGLKHPGIVSVYAAGAPPPGEGERPYVAMEYVEGKTLDVLYRQGLSTEKAVEIVRDAALAVAHAHENGVIHRDLKPRNILVDAEGRVRVTDFGLARPAGTLGPSDDALLSRQIHVHGTPSYMAPEQALDRTHDIGQRSDVYSLGATLYFLVTGHPPFDAGHPLKTCFSVVRDPLVPPSRRNPGVSPDIEQVILRAMDKDPIRRYASARALAEDLDRILQGAPLLSDEQMRFSQGLSALHAGRLEEAVHMFKDLIRLDAAGAASGTARQRVLAQLDSGEQGLTLAIERQPKNYDIRTQRGVYRFARALIQSLEGNDPSASCKSAMEDFVVAAQLRPEYTPARVNRANVLIFGGRYARDSGKDVSAVFEMALQDLDAAIGFDPTCSHAYHLRGIVHFYIARGLGKRRGDAEPHYRRAIDDFLKAAELEPTYAYIFKDLGVVKVALAKHLLRSGQKVKGLFEEAVGHLDTAIRLNPTLFGAYYERGQARFALKEFQGALEDFRRCLGIDPTRDHKVQALIEEVERRLRERS